MRWIVTFLDAIVLLYFLSGIVVWRNAFPDYIRSEYAEKINQNGFDAISFINRACVGPCFAEFRPPFCYYSISIKESENFLYRPLTSLFFDRGEFGRGGCSEHPDEIKTPFIEVLRAKNGLGFVFVFRKKNYDFPEELFDLFTIPNNKNDSVLAFRLTKAKVDTSEKAVFPDDGVLEFYLDARQNVSCSVYINDMIKKEFDRPAYNRILNRTASAYFNDSARVHALYDAFGQLGLRPNCIDSLARLYKKNKEK